MATDLHEDTGMQHAYAMGRGYMPHRGPGVEGPYGSQDAESHKKKRERHLLLKSGEGSRVHHGDQVEGAHP